MSNARAKEYWRMSSGFAPKKEIDTIKEDIRKKFPLKSGWKLGFSFNNEKHYDNKMYVEILRSPIKFDFKGEQAIRITHDNINEFEKSDELSLILDMAERAQRDVNIRRFYNKPTQLEKCYTVHFVVSSYRYETKQKKSVITKSGSTVTELKDNYNVQSPQVICKGDKVTLRWCDKQSQDSIKVGDISIDDVCVNDWKERTFSVGDTVVHGSYNLIYTGEILKVGKKTITVNGHGNPMRMNAERFFWKNHKLDLAEVSKHNQETSYYI